MSAAPKRLLTPHEYLARERLAEFRSQFYGGEMFAMAGASFRHTRINDNLSLEVGTQLKNSSCQILTRDLRVKVDATGLYTYPDAIIVCGEPVFEDTGLDTLINPRVLIEILSESTEEYDRGAKFDQYRQIPTLQEYVLVSQDEYLIERHVRQPDGSWLPTTCSGPTGIFEFASVPVRVPLTEIYRGVTFPEPTHDMPGSSSPAAIS